MPHYHICPNCGAQIEDNPCEEDCTVEDIYAELCNDCDGGQSIAFGA